MNTKYKFIHKREMTELVHVIDIEKPIWKKPRSVGLKISGLNPETVVHVNILYKNKKGARLWPNTLYMSWMKLTSYPIQKLKNGTVLVIVPIKDFNIILPEINSNTKSIPKTNETMTAKKKDESFVDIWSSEAIDAHEEKHSEKGAPREIIPFGHRLLCITGAELTLTKKHNEPMIKLIIEDCNVNEDDTVVISDEYYPINEYYIIGGDRKTKNGDKYISQIGADRIRGLMLDGFNYKFKAIAKDDFEALVTQISDFFNKPFRAAVRHVDEIYKSNKDNKMHQVTRVNMWYAGNFNDTDFKVNDTKMVVGLSATDKATLEMDSAEENDSFDSIEDDDSNPFD